MNWIIPGKILAFSSPSDTFSDGSIHSKFFIDKFQKMKINGIIRLNERMYDENNFKNNGINVYDLEFTDGSCPNDVIFLLLYFLSQ